MPFVQHSCLHDFLPFPTILQAHVASLNGDRCCTCGFFSGIFWNGKILDPNVFGASPPFALQRFSRQPKMPATPLIWFVVMSSCQLQRVVAGVLRFDAALWRSTAAWSAGRRRLGMRVRRQRPVPVLRRLRRLLMLLTLLSRFGCRRRRRVLFVVEGVSTHEVGTLVDVLDDAVHERRRQASTAAVRQPVRYAVAVRLSGEALQTHAGVLVVADPCRVGGCQHSAAASNGVRDVVGGLVGGESVQR